MMVKITIDDQKVEVTEGTTVLEAAKSVQVEIPCFCYHPKLSIAGNCRMCLVQIEGQPKPVISCREQVWEGMVVHTKTEEVKKMQQGVLEFILLNHPLDCPICDQSGECDLQDHYFKFSNFPSRLEDQKIHKPKVKPLGPLVTLDDERCIVCTRCVRFCDEIAGVHELCVIERGGHATLTTYPGKELKNPYSLCTVDVCPVGALTSTDFRFKKRVWFLKSFRSVCTGCATGCNIRVDQDDSIVYRYKPRDNEAVNQCWMCDEGRLSYKFINAENRVLEPMVRKNDRWQAISWEEARTELKVFSPSPAPPPLVAVLSAQATCEENFALYTYAKQFNNVQFMAVGREVQNPSQDGFLISPDKNPNWGFLKMLEKNGVSYNKEIPDNATVMALDFVPAKVKAKKIICFASNLWEPFDWADIILPKPTFVEQDGTFINKQNRIQRAWKGFEPRGHARPVWEILSVFNSAEETFRAMTEVVDPLRGLTYGKVGDQGLVL